ncbi:MAG: cyclic nucleotide-binding domain-containing protein, partial [Fibrobacterota bacterium]
VVKGMGAHAVDLSRIRQNECVGEMVVFEEGELRSASLFAVGDCALLAFHRDDLNEAIIKHPAIATELIKIFSRRLREANAKLLVANKAAAV